MLKSAPKISDNRSKDEVFQRLLNDPRIHDEKLIVNEEVLTRKRNWLPPFVTVAALALLAILVLPMLNNLSSEKSSSNMAADSSAGVESSAFQANEPSEESADMQVMNQAKMVGEISSASLRTAAYAQDVGDGAVFYLGMASSAATSLPVTFIVPRAQIEADFGNVQPTSYDLYMKYASQIDEQALGFSEYHPYKGTLTQNGQQLIFTMPKSHQYDIASAALETFMYSLQDTFYGFEEIIFQTNSGERYTFSQVGEPSGPMPLNTFDANHYAYFVFEDVANGGKKYLSPNFNVRYDSVIEAINAMSITNNEIFSSAIPSGVAYDVSENGDVVTIRFKEAVDLTLFDPQQAMQMIEAFTLTAASFHKQVILQNIVQNEWEGFNFAKPLPVPIGPNKVEWDFSN